MQLQQRLLRQHKQLLDALSTSSTATEQKPRFGLTKSELSDGQSCSPEGSIDFYGYASEKNFWTMDEDHIKNITLFLTGMAKKWYELRMFSHANDAWEAWKPSFVQSFGESAGEKWDRATFYKFMSGLILDYFFEKGRLL